MADRIGQTDGKAADHIWSFRGYRLSPGEFNNAMIHMYRGEVSRSNTWRARLDTTTNWAVVATGATLSFTFGAETAPHFLVPVNTLLITLFLYIEARRYQYYELWSYRVRLMETDFFAAMLAPPFQPSETWATRLVDSLLHPKFTITFWEAFGRRFRRNYMFIFLILGFTWILKIMVHPTVARSVDEFLFHASIGPIPGATVIIAGLAFNVAMFVMGVMTAGLRESKGEVLRETELQGPMELFHSAADVITGHGLHLPGRHEQLAHIITNKGEEMSERILHTMAAGVTAVNGKGMYSGEERMVLLVAVHPNQVADLKRLVREIDPKAFVIIHHAEEVIGAGFRAPS